MVRLFARKQFRNGQIHIFRQDAFVILKVSDGKPVHFQVFPTEGSVVALVCHTPMTSEEGVELDISPNGSGERYWLRLGKDSAALSFREVRKIAEVFDTKPEVMVA